MWTYEQLFNDLSTGDLNGQDSWVANTKFDVTTVTPYEGDKCVSIVHNADSRVSAYRTISAISDGIVYVSLKIDRTTGTRRASLELYAGSTLVARVFIYNSGSGTIIDYLTNAGDLWVRLLTGGANNTWYRIGIQFDDPNQPNKYRVNLDNGTWSSWVLCYPTPTWSTVDKILLADDGNNGSGSGTFYFDTISPNYTPGPTFDYQISGVVTLNGVNVEGAVVRCIRQSDNVAITEQTTSSTGAYLFTELEETELYHLCVEYIDGTTKYNAKSYWDIVPIEVEL